MRIVRTWECAKTETPETVREHDDHVQLRRIVEHHRRIALALWEDFAAASAAKRKVKRKAKGGKRQKKPVWCAETGQRFESLASAAKVIGVTPTAICKALREGFAVGRKHWTAKTPN